MVEKDNEDESCSTCSDDPDVPDINNAMSYLLEKGYVMADWDGVEKDLQGNKEKSAVECMLDHIYVVINDKCLLDASYEVFKVFRERAEGQYNKTGDSLQELWFDIVETLSRTYSECSSEFREEVKQHNEDSGEKRKEPKRRGNEQADDSLSLGEEEEPYSEGYY